VSLRCMDVVTEETMKFGCIAGIRNAGIKRKRVYAGEVRQSWLSGCKSVFCSVVVLLLSIIFLGRCSKPVPVEIAQQPTATVHVELPTCALEPSPSRTETTSPEPTQTHQPTSTQTPTVTPTTKPEGCTEEHGYIEQKAIDSDLLAYQLTFRVHLPLCYDPSGDIQYPVLYLLHGQSYNDDQWDRLGVDEAADEMIRTGEAPAFIIVMPTEKYYLKNSNESDFDIAMLEVLVPWVDEAYAACAEPSCRSVGGISRGAAWAMRLGLRNWEVFGAIGAHSFPPFRGDIYNLSNWLEEFPVEQQPRIYIDIGRYDPYLAAAINFEKKLTEYKAPHEWHLFDGAHNEAYWESHIEDYLRWYTQPWK